MLLFFTGLYYHAFSIVDYIALNSRRIGEFERIWKEAAVT
jgi:hypothetical protein